MSKVVKYGVFVAMAGAVLLSSGCSCSVKQNKIDERSELLSKSELVYLNNEAVDFTATYKSSVSNLEDGEVKTVENYTYIVSRDMETKKYVLNTTTSKGNAGEELPSETINESIYVENDKIYVSRENKEADPTITQLEYPSTYNAYSSSKDLVEEGLLQSDYFALINGTYDDYKTVPFNACASSGDKTKVTNILEAFSSELTCEATKKLFDDEITYDVVYRVSVDTFHYVTIKVNGDNKLSYVKIEKNSIKTKEVVEFTISYDDVSFN